MHQRIENGRFLEKRVRMTCRAYIGKTLTPASLSTTGATIGCDKNGPMTGIDLRNCTNVAKNSPKSAKMPKVSMTNPKKECFVKMRTMPIAKQIVPRIF